MDIFTGDDNKTYVAIDLSLEKEAALTQANKYFRISKKRLNVGHGWLKDDLLYFSEKCGAKKCWIFWRKTSDEI